MHNLITLWLIYLLIFINSGDTWKQLEIKNEYYTQVHSSFLYIMKCIQKVKIEIQKYF